MSRANWTLEHAYGRKEPAPVVRRAYRIRPCGGDKKAWCLVALRSDGTEMNSYGSFTTSYSLDLLLAHAGHLAPNPGDEIDFVPMVSA